jgi:FkbM family methyltransferase
MWPFRDRFVPLASYNARPIRRLDPYFFFAEDVLAHEPVLVEIGSYTGDFARRLYETYKSRVIVYEAGAENYQKLTAALAGLPIVTHHEAVTGTDGTVTFYEFPGKPDSNSVLRRSKKKAVPVPGTVASTSVERMFVDNRIDRIDALFTNCEGGELGILDEMLAKPDVWRRVRQTCVSFHPQIYGPGRVRRLLRRMEPLAEIIKDTESKWPCHLFINRSEG